MPVTTTLHEMTDVIGQLYQMGSLAQERTAQHKAVEWFVQALSAIRRDREDNQEMLGLILFQLGKAVAYDPNSTHVAVTCCEASTDINKRVGQNEYQTDCIYMAASIVEILEDFPAAVRMYQRALDRYRLSGNKRKAQMVQEVLRSIMHRMGERAYRQIKFDTAPLKPYRFIIRYRGQSIHRLIINRDGCVEWKDYLETLPTLTLESAAGWEIICDHC